MNIRLYRYNIYYADGDQVPIPNIIIDGVRLQLDFYIKKIQEIYDAD